MAFLHRLKIGIDSHQESRQLHCRRLVGFLVFQTKFCSQLFHKKKHYFNEETRPAGFQTEKTDSVTVNE